MKACKSCIYTNYIPYCFTIMDVSIQGRDEKNEHGLIRFRTDLKHDREKYQLDKGRKLNSKTSWTFIQCLTYVQLMPCV